MSSITATNGVSLEISKVESHTPPLKNKALFFVAFIIPLAMSVVSIGLAGALWVRVEQLETELNDRVLVSADADPPAGFVTSSSILTGAGSWAAGTKMPSAHSDQQAVTCAGKIYLLGGQDADRNAPTVLGGVLAFDPVNEVYLADLAPMPTPRYRFGAACLDDQKIYVAGGFENATAGNEGWSMGTVDVYDIATNTWAGAPPLAEARGDLALAAVDGDLYAIGGYDWSYTPLATVEKLTSGAVAWALGTPMLTPKGDLQSAVIDGKVYVPGGWNGEQTFLRELAIFDPQTSTWSLGPSMAAPRGDMAVAALDGNLFVVGGEMWSGVMSTCDWGWGPEECAVNLIPMHGVEMFSPQDQSWTHVAPLPASRFRFAAAAVEGRMAEGAIYAFGGHAHGEVAVDTLDTFHYVPRSNLFFHTPP